MYNINRTAQVQRASADQGQEMKMSNYKVSAVRINDGVITSDFYDTTKSIKSFFADADKKEAIEVFKVAGWKFSRIYLTHGTQENGEGWAFFR